MLETLPVSMTHIVFPAIATGIVPERNGIQFTTAFYFWPLKTKLGLPNAKGLNAIFVAFSSLLPGLLEPTFATFADLRVKTFWEIIAERSERSQRGERNTAQQKRSASTTWATAPCTKASCGSFSRTRNPPSAP